MTDSIKKQFEAGRVVVNQRHRNAKVFAQKNLTERMAAADKEHLEGMRSLRVARRAAREKRE